MKSVSALKFLSAAYLLPLFCQAQTVTTAKLYGHIALNGAISIPVFEDENNDMLAFRWLAPAIKFQYENGRYDELELTDLVFQRAPNAETDTRFSMGLRYEHGYPISKKEAAPLRLSAGFSFKAYGAIEQLNALNILGLGAENRFYGISLAITPHLEYRIYKKLVFDFSPYVELANGATRLEYVYDPFIEEEQRQSVDFYFKGMQCFLRLGLGWQF